MDGKVGHFRRWEAFRSLPKVEGAAYPYGADQGQQPHQIPPVAPWRYLPLPIASLKLLPSCGFHYAILSLTLALLISWKDSAQFRGEGGHAGLCRRLLLVLDGEKALITRLLHDLAHPAVVHGNGPGGAVRALLGVGRHGIGRAGRELGVDV